MRAVGITLGLLAALVALGLYYVFGTGPVLHTTSDLSDLIGTPDSPIIIEDTSALEDQVLIEKDVGVMTRDGIRLSANIFRPKLPGKYPVVMTSQRITKTKHPISIQIIYGGMLVRTTTWDRLG